MRSAGSRGSSKASNFPTIAPRRNADPASGTHRRAPRCSRRPSSRDKRQTRRRSLLGPRPSRDALPARDSARRARRPILPGLVARSRPFTPAKWRLYRRLVQATRPASLSLSSNSARLISLASDARTAGLTGSPVHPATRQGANHPGDVLKHLPYIRIQCGPCV